jgi:hypothetical protein
MLRISFVHNVGGRIHHDNLQLLFTRGYSIVCRWVCIVSSRVQMRWSIVAVFVVDSGCCNVSSAFCERAPVHFELYC